MCKYFIKIYIKYAPRTFKNCHIFYIDVYPVHSKQYTVYKMQYKLNAISFICSSNLYEPQRVSRVASLLSDMRKLTCQAIARQCGEICRVTCLCTCNSVLLLFLLLLLFYHYTIRLNLSCVHYSPPAWAIAWYSIRVGLGLHNPV